MYKLVILCLFDRMSGMKNREARGNFEFETREAAELRALLWLNYCPFDIVMIVRTKCHGDGESHCCCDSLEDCVVVAS